MNGRPNVQAATVDVAIRSKAPAALRSSSGANTVILALVVALLDLELQRDTGKVPSPLRSKTAA
jgi:hypothetical protein